MGRIWTIWFKPKKGGNTMITHKKTPLFADEKFELLTGEKFKFLTVVRRGQYKYYNDEKLKFFKKLVVPNPYEYDKQMSWFTKDMVLNTIKERWDFYSFYIKVNYRVDKYDAASRLFCFAEHTALNSPRRIAPTFRRYI